MKFDDNIKEAFTQSPKKSPVTKIPGQVFPVNKPPHKRSSAPLRKIHIREIGYSDDEEKEVEIKIPSISNSNTCDMTKKPIIEFIKSSEDKEEMAIKSESPFQTELQSDTTKSRGLTKQVENEFNESKKKVVCQKEIAMSSASQKKPSSSVQFNTAWTKLSNIDEKVAYLELITKKDYAKIFKHSMEPILFSDILRVLKNMNKVSYHLQGISQIPRISALIMFLEEKENAILCNLLQKAKSEDLLTSNDLEKIEKVFK